MNEAMVNSRREFLKNIGIGSSLVLSGVFGDAQGSPARITLPAYDVDVLVVGGGPAGIGAAIASSRAGAKTLLIENQAFFGGIASFCLGMNINQMRPGSKPRSAVHELLISKLQGYGDLAVQFRGHSLRCNVEYLKVAVIEALDEAGCEYLVHTQAVDAVMQGNKVTGVVAATKKGLVTIGAKAVVDCSGDADICHFAGAETLYDKDNSPMTLCFNLTNFDIEKVRESQIRSALKQGRKSGKYPLIPSSCLVQGFPSSNAVNINHKGTRMYGPLDGTDPAQLTIAECFSRRQAVQMVAAIREFGGEGLENIELINTGPQIGVRESRRLRGVYILTEEDAVTGRKFEDGIAWRSGAIDVGGGVYDAKMKVHDVPYRSLLPVKVDGLLAAGRCLSTTHIAHSAGKSMGNCMATGHAAGLAAAICAKQGILPRKLDVAHLRTALANDRVNLEMSSQTG